MFSLNFLDEVSITMFPKSSIPKSVADADIKLLVAICKQLAVKLGVELPTSKGKRGDFPIDRTVFPEPVPE